MIRSYFVVLFQNMRRVLGHILINFLVISGVKAQDSENFTTPYRPKIAEFSVETLMDYRTQTSSESFGAARNEVERDRLVKAKAIVPVFIKNGHLVCVQLKYYQQRFIFDLEDWPTDNDLYLHLDTEVFTNAGARAFYKRDLENGRELVIAAGAEIKSDQIAWNQNTSKYLLSGVYKWKTSGGSKLGLGLMANHVMGLSNVLPLFFYEQKLGPKWTLDLSLPKSISTRYRANEKNVLLAKTQFTGWRYNLTNALEDEPANLTLRKADLQFSLSWEHEIHDWLWFGVDAGYTKNLTYYLANPGDRGRDALIDIRPKDAFFTKFSIFLVPPRKMYR